MSKYFSPVVDRYLKAWLSRRTWDSGHTEDMRMFYQFLKSLKRLRHDWSIDFGRKLLEAVKAHQPNFPQE